MSRKGFTKIGVTLSYLACFFVFISNATDRTWNGPNNNANDFLIQCVISMGYLVCLAERQGFEPWEGCPSTVFKTAAFDRSAISPTGKDTILMTLILQIFFEYSKKIDLILKFHQKSCGTVITQRHLHVCPKAATVSLGMLFLCIGH